MNTKTAIFFLFALIGLIFLLEEIPTAQEQEEMPEEITIYTKEYRRKLFKPINFNHQEHADDYGIECNECHHDYKDGKNVWEEGNPVKKCIVCHNPKKKQGRVHRLAPAYHFNCKKCHKENNAGPVKCEECHTKRDS